MAKWIGNTIIWFSLALTLSLFVLAKLDQGSITGFSWLLLSQLLSLIGTTLLAMSFLLSGRFKFLENWFGGMDKVYKTHHITGGIAFVMLLHHPLFLVVNILPNVDFGWKYFWFSSLWSYDFGIASLYLMLLMLVFTLLINLPYSIWKKTHELMGIGLMFGVLHIFTISSDVSRYMPLRWWMIVLLSVAGWSVVYKKFLYEIIGPRYKYLIEKVELRGDIFMIWLKPATKKMTFVGGQFVFAVFDKLGKEQHPFSIASAPEGDSLVLGIKVLGDYTLTMKDLKVSDTATIWGPYGNFYEKSMSKSDLVWIAGGIGITPFMSMLPSFVNSGSGKKVDLFYCVTDKNEMVFEDEIRNMIGQREEVRYWEFCSNDRGRITAKAVVESVGSLENKKIMLCGPVPMMESLAKQFKELGVKNRNIIFEDFNFK